MKHILDAKYSKADIKTIAESSTNLDLQERNYIYTLLKKYESLFDCNLGLWNGNPYDIKLKTDAEPLWKTFSCSTHTRTNVQIRTQSTRVY